MMDLAGCQAPGNRGEYRNITARCKQVIGITETVEGDPCCEGSTCQQFFSKKGKPGHYYCMYEDCIPSGESCDVSKT